MINVNYETGDSILTAADACAAGAGEALRALRAEAMPFTGWVNYAERLTDEAMSDIEQAAAKIRADSGVFVVIGIGGSYLGAKAALDFIGGGIADGSAEEHPRIEFAGFNLSAAYHAALLKRIEGDDISICHISKSGGTLEPGTAFDLLRSLLIRKYGEAGADARTYVVTDPQGGKLKAMADERGWKSFPIPSDIGGRYSVLTPVGLLPLAVAGIDIREIVSGARAVMGAPETALAGAVRLACVRKAIQDSGKAVEVIAAFEPAAASFTDWMLQLYGESEGKDGKGMLPVGVVFTRDLHSLGQFLQEGNQIFSETFLRIVKPPAELGDMNRFNEAALRGTLAAHRSANIPVTVIDLPDMSARSFGEAVQFFEIVCGVTGILMGVDPFNQPGVEAYKREMMALI
ncbi:MAG: glucose-6-phosphate isomerase [Clostridiales Family XIII bacterium]|jgi:glucose-6-phosphate isomerase|nr:glucose-6-phosphate isomerase [Clostridiales Family XIII bacterium]